MYTQTHVRIIIDEDYDNDFSDLGGDHDDVFDDDPCDDDLL